MKAYNLQLIAYYWPFTWVWKMHDTNTAICKVWVTGRFYGIQDYYKILAFRTLIAACGQTLKPGQQKVWNNPSFVSD